MSIQKVDIALDLGLSQDFNIVSSQISEGISELTHARIEIASIEDLDLDGVLEAPAVVTLSLDGFEARKWTLRTGAASFLKTTKGTYRYQIDLYPAFWLLRYTTNTRKFRNLTSQDIITKILDEHQVKHEWQITRKPPVRKYCVQYRESNLDFINRLLEFEGIFFTFSPEGLLVLGDKSSASPTVEGQSVFELMDAQSALSWDEVGIYAFRKGARVASGTATVNDFNWKKPKISLLKSKSAELDAELEIYDYPTGYRRVDQGDLFAGLRLEAHRVPARFVQGGSNVPSFAPSRVFTYGGAANPRMAGEYLLQKLEHIVVVPAYAESANDKVDADAFDTNKERATTYKNTFHAIPREVPFRPALNTKYPHIAGCHTAMVRGPKGEEIHTDQFGRFRAQFHWDREGVGTDDDSRWVRNLQETATSMVLARVGWEYSMAYIDGDPDRPIGLARNINGVMKPEYSQPANKTRMTIKTPSSPATGGFNELRLEDVAGSQHFDWKAEKDFIGEVVNDRNETVGNDENHTVKSDMIHSVEHDQKVSIGGNFKVTIGNDQPLSVDKDRTKTVGGNETIEVGKVLNISTQGNETEDVGADRKTKAGEDGGAITRVVEETMKRTIKASLTTTGKGDITTIVGDAYTEEIEGDKTTKAVKGMIKSTISGPFKIDVTGEVMRKSESDMGYSADRSNVTVTGATTFKSDEGITIQGNHIIIEADSSLTLTSGALEIAMTPGSTKLKGKMVLDGKDSITVTGNPDNITS